MGNLWKSKDLRRTAGLLLPVSLLLVGMVQAQYVRVAPPPPVAERLHSAPARGYVWIPGYQRWDGKHYLWVSGRWVVPPQPKASWVPGHWLSSPRGWYWVPGHWIA